MIICRTITPAIYKNKQAPNITKINTNSPTLFIFTAIYK